MGRNSWGWEIFTACMFIGLGVGMLLNRSGAGVIIGMGVGFLLSSIIRIKTENTKFEVKIPKNIGVGSITAIGILFIILGLWMLNILPTISPRLIGGIIIILLGIALLSIIPSLIKRTNPTKTTQK